MGYLLAVNPFDTFLTVCFEPMYTPISDSRKPCWFCWLNLSVLQFFSSLIVFGNNVQAKKRKKGVQILEI